MKYRYSDISVARGGAGQCRENNCLQIFVLKCQMFEIILCVAKSLKMTVVTNDRDVNFVMH